ncbi:hypothetical protein BYT27DRAFT_7259008 [Phlegmacium glaucopus]|nr:hypothetical protein BYT27DRAFT_7259008 [Phlegmacium glaucopus]
MSNPTASPTMQDPVPPSFDNNAAIASVLKAWMAVNNKLAHEDTRTSDELTVFAQDSPARLYTPSIVVTPAFTKTPQPSCVNTNVAVVNVLDTKTAVNDSLAHEDTQMTPKLTSFTQEYPSRMPKTSDSTASGVYSAVTNLDDGDNRSRNDDFAEFEVIERDIYE